MLAASLARATFDPDEEGARVVARGATHTSVGRGTSPHAHHAWKLHVGLDAPVWLASRERRFDPRDGARVLLVPPNFEHATGAVGWSTAIFVEPGSRGTPHRATRGPEVIEGALARRIVDAARAFAGGPDTSIAGGVDDTVRLAFRGEATPRLDRRVGAALDAQRRDPSVSVAAIALRLGISRDRLTHLFTQAIGISPRRHALWRRLLRVLSEPLAPSSLAAIAAETGFSDHAHMTRTFRRFLGRAPSEFREPPRVLQPW